MMIEKKDLLISLQALLKLEEELLSLCERQVGNAAFLSGLPPQGRSDVHTEFTAFFAKSQQHRQALEKLMGSVFSGGRDVY